MLNQPAGIASPVWYGAAAVGAVCAATVALVLSLRAPSDIAPAVVLAARTAPASTPISTETRTAAAATGRAATACGGAECPPVPVPARRITPAATEVTEVEQPADPDAWALDPRPLGKPSTLAPGPWTTLHNTPWAAQPAAPTDAVDEGDEAQGGGFEE